MRRPESIIQHLTDLQGQSVLVVGDVMLDEYVIGDVHRISPEAPIPILSLTRHHLKQQAEQQMLPESCSAWQSGHTYWLSGQGPYSRYTQRCAGAYTEPYFLPNKLC